jgi:hypothetical protein
MTGNTGDTGNTGNTGDTGNIGNTGNAGIQGEFGGGWFIEDRSDFPFVSEYDPTGQALEGQIQNLASFGERAWTARWWAILALQDFVGTGWEPPTTTAMNTRWALVAAKTATELVDLVNDHKNERAAAMGEILSQDVEFNTDFMAVLSITPGSHPNTYRIMHIASQVASYAALYYKADKDRPRPSQLLPALLPPVPMPGHASWPSGHATQAWLKTLCIEYVLSGVAGMGTAIGGPTPGNAAGTLRLGVISANLRTLALRIARNREIAGLHYRSDSDDGRLLADAIFPFLSGLPNTSWFKKAVTLARTEWV